MFRGDTEIPDYMYAADTHQVANGEPSVLETGSFVDGAADFGKFTLAATARALTSTYNIIPTTANWFGADWEEAQTDEVLAKFDDNLAAYYNENRDSVDIVGDVAAMFIPGIAGIKGVNYAQKGLAAMSRGTNVGKNLARSFGTLPELGSKYAAEGAAKLAETGGTFKVLDGTVLKAFAANYAQGAVEMAAFEVAASAVMQNSPLFEDHSAKDILVNAALGGGIVGAGIMGTVASVQTYGQLRRAADSVGKLLAPFRHVKETEAGVDDFVKVLQKRAERDNFPLPGDTTADIKVIEAQSRLLETRQRNLNLEIQETLTKMAGGDVEVGAKLASSLDAMPKDNAWAATLQLQEAARVGTVTKLEMQAAAGKASDVVVKYLKLAGEDAGLVTHTPPSSVNLPDLVGSAKELAKDVERRLKSQPAVGSQFNPIGQNPFDVEARYLSAFKSEINEGMIVGGKDLPYLEAALAQNKGVSVDGVYMDIATLKEYVKKTKLSMADELADRLEIDPLLNSAIASKLINVRQGVLEGKGYRGDLDSHFFAMQESVGGELNKLWEPTTVKVVYKGDPAAVGVSGNELSGMVAIKELQAAQQKTNLQAATHVLGEDAAKLPRISDELILDATTRGSGAGVATMASSEYGTLGSVVEWTGKVVSEMKQKAHTKINDTFQAPMHKWLNNTEAQNEVFVLRQAVLGTGEKYVLQEREGVRKAILKQVDDFERKVIAGKNPVEPEVPAGVMPELVIKTDEAWELLQTLTKHNSEHITKEKTLRNAVGKSMGDWEGVVYFPQPATKSHPYFSFIQPKNPWEGEKMQMIWARTPEELAKLEASVPMDYRILRKSDTDKYYKAIKEYDYDLGMNSRDFMSELKRSGVAAPFIPKTNAPELAQDLLDHYKRVADKQIRDAVTLQNSVAFSELRRMDTEFKAVRGSKKVGGEDIGVTPYESYVKTALDIPRSSSVPVWTELNNLAENVVSKVFNSVQETWAKMKSPEDMAALNKHFDDAGFRGVKDAYTEMIANHPADKRVLSNFVQSANGLFSTLILRTDPMNALNNGVGNMVLTGSETAFLTRMIKGKGGQEAESFLREMSEIRLPGSEAYIKSPTKLISRAYGDFFAYMRGEEAAVKRFAKYEVNGWTPSMMDQLKASFDSLTLTGKETAGELQGKISKMMESTGNFLEKATGNKLAEEMNRFVAAHIADDISQAGIKYAGLDEKQALAFINTFVNRTQGNYVASQRPLMFQGPIGQSISLFMTYQFNMMQHVFRHMSNEGGRKSAATLLGLQTSIYGMNGLPAFNFMNEHLVGNAAGNRTHKDVHSVMLDIPAVGDWLLYGGLSNATGLGLYSRGDLNPRHLTVVPSSLKDIPFISATTNVLGSIGKAASEIGQGANPMSAILRGIEHAGVSRPLAGLAQVLNGVQRDDNVVYSTTGKGNVVYAQDLYSLATLGRLAGARPLDEAITRDAYHRVQVYEGQDKNKIKTLGASIRDRVNSGADLDDADVENFMQSYVAAGGNQRTFVQYYQNQVKNAGTNQIKKLVERGNSSYGQYMQNLMRAVDSDPMNLEN